MKKQQKKNLIGISIFIIIIIIIIFVIISRGGEDNSETNTQNLKTEEYTIQQTNGDKVNTSDALKQPRKELVYYVKNISLQKKDGQTIFKIDVQNQGSENIKGQLVDIVFIDKNGAEEERMALYIREIKAGETITTQATIENDFTNVYNFKLQKKQIST